MELNVGDDQPPVANLAVMPTISITVINHRIDERGEGREEISPVLHSIKKVGVDKSSNCYLSLINEFNGKVIISFRESDFPAFKECIDKAKNGASLSDLKFEWFVFYSPKTSETTQSELWLAKLYKIDRFGDDIRLNFDWRYYGTDKSDAMNEIAKLSESTEMMNLAAVINEINKRNEEMPDIGIDKMLKQINDLARKQGKNIDIVSFNPVEFSKNVFGYKEFGGYMMRENKSPYEILVTMPRKTIEHVITSIESTRLV